MRKPNGTDRIIFPMNFLARNTSLNDSLLRRFGILVYVFYRLYHILEHTHPTPAPSPPLSGSPSMHA